MQDLAFPRLATFLPPLVVVIFVVVLALVFKHADKVHFLLTFKVIKPSALGLLDLSETRKTELKEDALCRSPVILCGESQRHQQLDS